MKKSKKYNTFIVVVIMLFGSLFTSSITPVFASGDIKVDQKVEELERQIDVLENNKVENEKEIDRLNRKLEKCRDSGKSLRREKEELKKDIEEKQFEIEELNEELSKLKNCNNDKLEDLQREMKSFRDEIDVLRNDL